MNLTRHWQRYVSYRAMQGFHSTLILHYHVGQECISIFLIIDGIHKCVVYGRNDGPRCFNGVDSRRRGAFSDMTLRVTLYSKFLAKRTLYQHQQWLIQQEESEHLKAGMLKRRRRCDALQNLSATRFVSLSVAILCYAFITCNHAL